MCVQLLFFMTSKHNILFFACCLHGDSIFSTEPSPVLWGFWGFFCAPPWKSTPFLENKQFQAGWDKRGTLGYQFKTFWWDFSWSLVLNNVVAWEKHWVKISFKIKKNPPLSTTPPTNKLHFPNTNPHFKIKTRI